MRALGGPDVSGRRSIVLVDGENIDTTLGMSILGRKPMPEERPRWDRVLSFVRERTEASDVRGLFFLAANDGMPMAFVQAITAIGYRPIPLSGPPGDKIVDRAILRTLDAVRRRPDDDVFLVSNDGDFLNAVGTLLRDRRVGVLAVGAFNVSLPRLRVIPIDEFDPETFLD